MKKRVNVTVLDSKIKAQSLYIILLLSSLLFSLSSRLISQQIRYLHETNAKRILGFALFYSKLTIPKC